MNYYYEVKAGCCLRLSRCRVCKYRGSYEITNNSRVTLRNVQPGIFFVKKRFTDFAYKRVEKIISNSKRQIKSISV